jgi:hypothetical protein
MFERFLFGVAFAAALTAALWIPLKSMVMQSAVTSAALSVAAKAHAPGGKE